MLDYRTAIAGTFLAVMAAASVVGAQAPRSPGEVVPFEEERKGPPRSDGYRLVGKVLAIDRTQGALDLQTDEGRLTVKAASPLVNAARVGDMVSVERPSDSGGYAAPRGDDRSGRKSR